MIQMVVFIIGTAGLIYISRASLLHPCSHGFYRFFVWEAILALILLNIDHWFVNPFSWYQMISWPVLAISLFLIIYNLRLLKRSGKPDAQRVDAHLLKLEKTSELVKQGAYRYIRHPMYSSLLYLTWGVFFKLPSGIGLLLALIASGFLVATAKAEEIENIRFFGDPYIRYMQETKMFIPYIL